jgi:hypothetical protein
LASSVVYAFTVVLRHRDGFSLLDVLSFVKWACKYYSASCCKFMEVYALRGQRCEEEEEEEEEE